MQQQPLSANTYIQFSFEKSLRKYDHHHPHKKLKPNEISHSKSHCPPHNHSKSVCKHCIQKLKKKNSAHSNQRAVKLQTNRKLQIAKSRNLAREFSQIIKKRQSSAKRQESSAKRKSSSNKIVDSSVKRQNYHQPLSEFKLDQEINAKFSQQKEQLAKPFQDQGIMSIEKDFCAQNKQNEVKVGYMMSQNCQNNEKMIDQNQDQSFSKIEIGKKCENKNEKNCEQRSGNGRICHDSQPQRSFAYFSSYDSLDSCQSDNQSVDDQQKQPVEHEKDSPKIQANLIQSNIVSTPVQQNLLSDSFQMLKFQSKQELKRQIRDQHRERIFYKIKKVNDLQQVFSQCESISQSLQNQLLPMLQKTSEQQEVKSNENHAEMPQQQMDQQKSVSNNPESMEPQTNPSLKRQRKCLGTPFEQSTIRKASKINFEIEQNYQCLGRIRISGLGDEKQSICLSIRRFSQDSGCKSQFSSRGMPTKIDKGKMVDYLISQRPYLQKSRDQLMGVLSEIIESQEGDSVSKRLFEE